MSKRAKDRRRRNEKKVQSQRGPAGAANEIPDVSKRRSAWKYAVIAAVFIAWTALLLYCGLAGGL